MTTPRALCGPVWAMGRPSRPALEVAAVRAAAALIQRETGLSSPPAIAHEVSARVVTSMLELINRDPDDELAGALAAVERQVLASPIITLATCPHIDTTSTYVDRRVELYRARAGRDLTQSEARAEQVAVAADVRKVLAGRYLRHLRASM